MERKKNDKKKGKSREGGRKRGKEGMEKGKGRKGERRGRKGKRREKEKKGKGKEKKGGRGTRSMDTYFLVYVKKAHLAIALIALGSISEDATVHSGKVCSLGRPAACRHLPCQPDPLIELAREAQPISAALNADDMYYFCLGKKIHSTINDCWSISSTIFFYIKIGDLEWLLSNKPIYF
jgi:hypothetical protein